MANIQHWLEQIRRAIYGREVRSSIADAIEAINKEQSHLDGAFNQLIINAGNSNAEVVDARVKADGTQFNTLGDRLAKSDEQFEELNKEVIEARTDKAGVNHGRLKVRLDNIDEQLDNIPKQGFDDSTITTMKERYDSMHVNVKDFGAIGDGVTDDSNAIKSAINYMCSKAKFIDNTNTWKSFMPVLYFPAGKYLVTQNGVLNCVGGALQGYNIKGAGYMNTEILFTGNDYLLVNGDNNWFGFSYIEDLSIRGNGKNNFWKIKSRIGSPQANRFRRVNFVNLNNCVTVSFGTDNANADLFRFDLCKATDINGWVFGNETDKNSQSIVHTFNDCDFEQINGYIIYLKSGGAIEIRGGSWILNQTGRAFHFDDLSGAGIGESNKNINVYGTKFEYQYYSTNDTNLEYYPLFYNNSRMLLNFFNCNFNQFVYKGNSEKSFYGYIGQLGQVSFENCIIPIVFQIKVDPNLNSNIVDDRTTVLFRKCDLKAPIDKIVIQQNNNIYQGGNYATVIAEDTKSINCYDTQLNQYLGNRAFTTTKKMKIFTQNSNPMTSLPAKVQSSDENKVMIINLPIGAIVTDIRIYFTTINDGTTHNIKVTDNRNNEIISGSHIGTSKEAVFSTADLFKIIKTEDDTILKVVGSGVNPNGGIGGFIVVEYY